MRPRILSKEACQQTCITPQRKGVQFSNEVPVKHSAMRSFLMLSLFFVALAGCREQKAAQTTTAATQTMAPAAAPAAPNGSDAMTQTVDVEDSRSEAEAGSVANGGSAPAAATTAAPAAKKSAPKKKK
jgi:hypothetical protein